MSEPLSPNSGTTLSPKTTDDVEDILKGDDKPPSDKKDEPIIEEEEIKPEEIKLVEGKEEVDIEEEITEEEDEETLKLEDREVEIEAPPRKRQIEAEFPKIFEKFPFLEKMLYRDKQYTEMFGSFDDAKEMAERAEQLTQFENQLLVGKTDDILKSVKDNDSKAFDKIVDDYLPALARTDKEAYLMVTGNIVKRLVIEMVSEAKSSDNEELQQAALLVNQFMFGSSKFEPIKTRAAAEDKPENVAERERLDYTKERFETSRDDLQSRCDNILRSTIDQYIDPKEHMTPFVKKQAIREALESLNGSLGKDPSLRRNLDRLWRSSFDEKFSKTSLSKIQSAYLGRAKAMLPAVIKKARAEALKDLPPRKRNVEEETEEQTPRSRGIQHAGRPSQQKKSLQMEKGETVTDFLMRD